MTTQDLSARLKSLFEANRGISKLTTSLSKLSTATDAHSDSGDERVELSAEIHQQLKELEEDFELIKQEAEDFTNSGGAGARKGNNFQDRDRVKIVTQLERLGEE